MKFFERAHKWLSGVEPQGIGTLLVGVAALVALWKTDSVMDEVLKIRSQADDIKTAVSTLQQQSNDLSTAIALLREQIKEMSTARTFESSPALKKADPSKEEIEKALEENFPIRPMPYQPTVVLPEEKRKEVVEQLYKARTPQQRSFILKNSLEYAPAFSGKATMPANSGEPK